MTFHSVRGERGAVSLDRMADEERRPPVVAADLRSQVARAAAHQSRVSQAFSTPVASLNSAVDWVHPKAVAEVVATTAAVARETTAVVVAVRVISAARHISLDRRPQEVGAPQESPRGLWHAARILGAAPILDLQRSSGLVATAASSLTSRRGHVIPMHRHRGCRRMADQRSHQCAARGGTRVGPSGRTGIPVATPVSAAFNMWRARGSRLPVSRSDATRQSRLAGHGTVVIQGLGAVGTDTGVPGSTPMHA